MLFSKVITVLKALDEEGFKRLEEFIHSPYFRVPPASVALFDYLAELYPIFPEKKLSTAHIEKLGGNLSTETKQYRAGSELMEAVEDFMAVDSWRKDERQTMFHRFKGLLELGLLEQFDADYKRVIGELSKDPEQDVQVFFYRHLLTELAFNGFDAKLNRTKNNDITPTLKTLDEFYALKMLRYLCEVVSRKQILGTAYNPADSALLIKTLEPFIIPRYPYPYLFVHVYQMLSSETFEAGEPHYKIIKEFVTNKTDDSLPESITESMSYAISWCLTWNARGYEQTADEYLWWTEMKIKYGLLLEQGKLFPISFRNVVVLAVAANRTAEWMLRFIKQYAPLLPTEHRDTNEAFAYGLYYYRTKDYKRAMQSFLTAQAKEEVIFNAIIRRWQWINTYEQDPEDTDLLFNQLLSFEKYILRNQEALHQFKTPFTLFISYAKKLIGTVGKKECHALKAKLDGENYFPGKPWLLQKLE